MLSFKKTAVQTNLWHWPYQFMILNRGPFLWSDDHEEVYDWCLHNLEDLQGWRVEYSGVVILRKSDAILFQLTWVDN